MLKELKTFLKKNPPDSMPFWPGAEYTTPFSLRTSKAVIDNGGSPGHLGTDRAGGRINHLLMPFSGTVEWNEVGGVAGSLTKIDSDEIQLELQVFHGSCAEELKQQYQAGEALPIYPDQLGFSLGVHTHNEGILPFNEDVADWLRKQSVRVDDAYIFSHCHRYGLDAYTVIKKLAQQMLDWGIIELWNHFAVRRSLPPYRIPSWGPGSTIHFDTRWLLQI